MAELSAMVSVANRNRDSNYVRIILFLQGATWYVIRAPLQRGCGVGSIKPASAFGHISNELLQTAFHCSQLTRTADQLAKALTGEYQGYLPLMMVMPEDDTRRGFQGMHMFLAVGGKSCRCSDTWAERRMDEERRGPHWEHRHGMWVHRTECR
jgi:hypothetical protein